MPFLAPFVPAIIGAVGGSTAATVAAGIGSAVIGGIASNVASKRAGKAARNSARSQQEAANLAIEEQKRSRDQGLGFLEPFGQLGQTGIDQASFLTNPQEQFDFLQSNPLFQMGLDNLNRTTQNQAASRGRLSAGDTLLDLNNNALLAASPLIQGQKNSIGDLLNFGSGAARAQANTAIGAGTNISNLITDRGAAGAAGIVGQANARNQGTQGLLDAGLAGINAFQGFQPQQPVQANNGFFNPAQGVPAAGGINPFQFDLVNRA